MAVYIIRVGYAGPVKIGKADDVRSRVASLQTAHYEELRIVRVFEGDAEALFHERFKHLRIRGEWFHYDDAMLSFDPPEVKAEQDLVEVYRLMLAQADIAAGASIREAAARNGMSKSTLHRALFGAPREMLEDDFLPSSAPVAASEKEVLGTNTAPQACVDGPDPGRSASCPTVGSTGGKPTAEPVPDRGVGAGTDIDLTIPMHLRRTA